MWTFLALTLLIISILTTQNLFIIFRISLGETAICVYEEYTITAKAERLFLKNSQPLLLFYKILKTG
jgi:hypothetical protein